MNTTLLPDEILGLRLGQTASTICPKCEGGANRDRSFSATRVEGGILFNCFRAKCGYRGYERLVPLADGVSSEHRRSEQHLRKPRKYSGEIVQVGDDVVALLSQRYGITVRTVTDYNLRWSPPSDRGSGRLLISIVRPDGRSDGFVARSLCGERPKSLTFCESTRAAPLSWFFSLGVVDEVFVVEDQLSALRLAQEGTTAVALLGTTFNHERALEVAHVADGKPIYLSLDRDATHKAVEYVKQFRYAGNFQLRPLTGPDIKDMTTDELQAWLDQPT